MAMTPGASSSSSTRNPLRSADCFAADLDPARSRELLDQMRAAGLPNLIRLNHRAWVRSGAGLNERAFSLK